MSPVVNRVVAFCLFLLVASAFAQETAQVALPSVTLDVAGRAVTAEVADEPQERQTGLMLRDTRPLTAGCFRCRVRNAPHLDENTRLPLCCIHQPGGIVVGFTI
jgi:hypothetical protein